MHVCRCDDDIQGLTLYILYGTYNEESSRKNKASEQWTSVCKNGNSIQTILKIKPLETNIPLPEINKFQQFGYSGLFKFSF